MIPENALFLLWTMVKAGDRVIYLGRISAEVEKVWKHKCQIFTSGGQRLTVPIHGLEIPQESPTLFDVSRFEVKPTNPIGDWEHENQGVKPDPPAKKFPTKYPPIPQLGYSQEVQPQQKRTLTDEKDRGVEQTSPKISGPQQLGYTEKAEPLKKRTLTEVDALIRAAHGLSDTELVRLKDAIEGLLDARLIQGELLEREKLGDTAKGKKNRELSLGHYELKTIKGHGPYLYLRYWSGGRHRSTYLGKGNASRLTGVEF